MGQPLNVGIIGCGKIARAYTATFAGLDDVRIVAVADLDVARAEALAAEIPDARPSTVDALLADPAIDLVVNLTIPAAHAAVSTQILAAGKAVYVEKPITATVAEGREVLAAAAAAGLTVSSAPDTVLGTGIQTARRAIADGTIGRPLAATATMVTPGHERWHPDPDFYYAPGGGPLLDMGPYYVTSLVHLLGPVVRAIGAAATPRATRTIGSGPRAGQVVPVTTPSHVTGVLEHESGALSTLLMSFDAVGSKASRIEVHGETGTLSVPDPNVFDGDVELLQLGGSGWRTLPASAGYVGSSRGYGVADARWAALAQGAATPVVSSAASGELALHVLDAMESLLRSAELGQTVALTTTAALPPIVPLTER